MEVNGLILPSSFERFIRRPDARIRSWLPKENLDAYGNEWRSFPMEVFTDPETMREQTAWLPGNERLANETEEQVAARNAASADLPGSIPWITDFSQIVQFGHNDTGEAYCFDFRDDPQKPSVIFMDGWYWRRVAPDFDTLLGILELYDGQDLDEREQEIERRRHPDGDPEEAEEEAEPVWAQVPVDLLASGSEPIIVNGLVLPAAFQAFLRRCGDRVWEIKTIPDTSDFSEGRFRPIDRVQRIIAGTHHLAETGMQGLDVNGLPPVMQQMANARSEEDRPGYLPRITDYSQIVQFGHSPSGLPFAFDFRENLQEPSVIYRPKWGVLRWRRIAPNFETFLLLLEGYEEE